MKNNVFKMIIALAFGLGASLAHAHFQLIAPASWIVEDERGDPQKIAPCGGTLADGGTRTGAVTEVTGGQLLRVAINETIYHPGHYRISLAKRINWLPGDTPAIMKIPKAAPGLPHFRSIKIRSHRYW